MKKIELLLKINFNFFLSLTLMINFSYSAYAQNRTSEESNLENENLTIEDMQKKYPSAEIKQVSNEQLEAIKKNGYYDECGPRNNELNKSYSAPGATNLNDGYPHEPQFNFNSSINYGGGGDKDFLILVVVVGVVVVASLVVYSVGYLYQTSTAGLKCLTWKDFGLRLSSIGDRNQNQNRVGWMRGVYFSTGYRVPVGVMGLLGEFGAHSIELTLNKLNSTIRNYNGSYLLIGPSFSIPFTSINENLFLIEILAGTSSNKDIGLMSTLRFGFSFRISPQVNLGINAGALLLNLKGLDNYIEDRDQLSYLYGVSMSYKW